MSKGQPGRAICTDCGNPVHGRGLCDNHYRQRKRAGTLPALPSAEDRFWPQVKAGSASAEWPWAGDCLESGYGRFWMDGKSRRAHRVAWEMTVGPIPEGLTIDHLCHDPAVCQLGPDCPHRRCCNPAHMELVPVRPNVLRGGGPSAANARKTHCKRGHLFDEANTYRHPGGSRTCRRCQRDYMRVRRAR